MTRLILIALLLFPLFAHPCFAIDGQEKAPEVDLSKRVERLELQQELHKNAQEQRLDERLKILEATVKDRHDSVVRESDRLHDRADTQLNWMMWGLGGLALLAAIGAVATAFLIYPKVKQAEKDQKECTKLREEIKTIKGEIDIIYSKALKKQDNISEIADEIKAKKNEILSNEISPEDAKRSKDYMNRKEAQAALFSQAMIHTKAKKWDAALILWQDYIEYDPENAEALFYAALSAGELANHPEEKHRCEALLEQADKWYERANALSNNNPSILCNWATLLSERGGNASGDEQRRFWKQAEERYHRATEADLQHADIWSNWGTLLQKRGKNTSGNEQQQFWDDATDKYHRATEIDSKHTNAWCGWGTLLLERGKKTSGNQQQKLWVQAEEKFRQTLSIDPNHLDVLFNLACLYGLRQDIDTCLEWLEKWFATNPVSAVEKLEKIQKDSDFDAVRDAPEFQTFLEQHREKPSSGED